jgi:hypothetical protein
MTQRRRTSKPDHVTAVTASDDRSLLPTGALAPREETPRIRPRTPGAFFDGRWFTRYRETVECDYYGRRVFRFIAASRTHPSKLFDVLFAVSVAVACWRCRIR